VCVCVIDPGLIDKQVCTKVVGHNFVPYQ